MEGASFSFSPLDRNSPYLIAESKEQMYSSNWESLVRGEIGIREGKDTCRTIEPTFNDSLSLVSSHHCRRT